MEDIIESEVKNLQIEFEWVMRDEVHSILKNLREILVECAKRFPVPLYENEGKRTEKFVLSTPQDQLKCSVTLTGDSITQADISFKLKRASSQVQRTSICPDQPWKLQQVQDAANHLQQAINHIDNVDENYIFKSCEEVLQIVSELIGALQRGRTSLIIPKKKAIDELMKGRNMKSLTPNLPEDIAISFFLQCHKLIIAVYQLLNVQGTMKMEATQAECSVGWLNEVLVLFTVGLTLCQQLKDKINAFKIDKPS
ncbi:protein rogdi-like isoform X1 [Teleopsis dalmanni]|uniref:protein rogdi-like isoform X1 n=2 Tax=Teleopsis dalmanni TaxID=139649 RepID=UPI0018CE27DC|nr:protein rogdi-like isoform X1 [Teleopsis dalmanni]